MDWMIYREFPEDLEMEWNQLLSESVTHVPFLRHEYLNIWWQTRGGGEWRDDVSLFLLAAREQGRLVGIAPLMYNPNYQGKRALMLLGSIEISDYLDFLVRPQDLTRFVSGLLDYLQGINGPDWEILDLSNILEPSPTLAALQAAAEAKNWPCTVSRLQHSPYIPLPGNFDAYLAGIDKKQRHEIRRKMRRAEESGRNLEWKIITDPADLDTCIKEFITLMEFEPVKAAFLTPAMREQFSRTLKCAFNAGCLRLAFLEIDGEKAAGHMSFDYLKRLWAYNSGVNPQFNELSPGWVLLGYELQWANENGYDEYDFMRGDEAYKYRFGAIDRFVMNIRIER